MARRMLLPFLLGCMCALVGPAAPAIAAEGEAVPPLPVVSGVGTAVGETVGSVTSGTQQAVEAVTKQPPPAGTPAPTPPTTPSSSGPGTTGGQPSGGGPVERVTHAAAEAVPNVTRSVTEAAAGATAAGTAATQSPAPPAPAAPSPVAAEPVATASADPPASAAAPDRRHRAHQPRAAAPDRAPRGVDPLAAYLAPLLDARDAAVPSTAELSRTAESFVSGLGAKLTDLSGPLLGGTDPATAGSPSAGTQAIADARVADQTSSTPSLLDPTEPASMLFFFLVLGGGAALLVYAFRRELVGGRPSSWRRRA